MIIIMSGGGFQHLRVLFLIYLILYSVEASQKPIMSVRSMVSSFSGSQWPSFCFYSRRRSSYSTADLRNIAIKTFAQSNDDSSHLSFYQRLGSPKHILAPMVAQSDLPFRLMCEQLYNVDLSYTQMIHAYNFVESNGEVFRNHHLDVYPHSLLRSILLGEEDMREIILSKPQENALAGLSEDDIELSRFRILNAIDKSGSKGNITKPTVVQIAAHDPKVAVEAALLILEKSGSSSIDASNAPVAAIDLNLGKNFPTSQTDLFMSI